jgi:hypothetical protein
VLRTTRYPRSLRELEFVIGRVGTASGIPPVSNPCPNSRGNPAHRGGWGPTKPRRRGAVDDAARGYLLAEDRLQARASRARAARLRAPAEELAESEPTRTHALPGRPCSRELWLAPARQGRGPVTAEAVGLPIVRRLGHGRSIRLVARYGNAAAVRSLTEEREHGGQALELGGLGGIPSLAA